MDQPAFMPPANDIPSNHLQVPAPEPHLAEPAYMPTFNTEPHMSEPAFMPPPAEAPSNQLAVPGPEPYTSEPAFMPPVDPDHLQVPETQPHLTEPAYMPPQLGPRCIVYNVKNKLEKVIDEWSRKLPSRCHLYFDFTRSSTRKQASRIPCDLLCSVQQLSESHELQDA